MARIRPQPVDPFEIDHDRAERLRLVAVKETWISDLSSLRNYSFRLPWPMPSSMRNASRHSSGQSHCVGVLDHHSLSTGARLEYRSESTLGAVLTPRKAK